MACSWNTISQKKFHWASQRSDFWGFTPSNPWQNVSSRPIQSPFKPSKIRPLPPDALDIVLKEWALAPWMRKHNLLACNFMVPCAGHFWGNRNEQSQQNEICAFGGRRHGRLSSRWTRQENASPGCRHTSYGSDCGLSARSGKDHPGWYGTRQWYRQPLSVGVWS